MYGDFPPADTIVHASPIHGDGTFLAPPNTLYNQTHISFAVQHAYHPRADRVRSEDNVDCPIHSGCKAFLEGDIGRWLNHSPDPNGKLVWFRSDNLPGRQWRSAYLAFVALRDILPGEELTIRYGPRYITWN
jgi:hypothetical protein